MLPIRKRKSIGQHLLINKEVISNICDFIIDNVPVNPYTLFEIGSGEGTITLPILKKLKTTPNKPLSIILNEIDYRYTKILKERIEKENFNKEFRIEFLNTPFEKCKLQQENLYIIGNIPFYITGLVFRKIIQNYEKIINVVINIQKEVVDKISNPDNPLGIVMNIGWEIKKGTIIPPNFYDPKPKVFSQLVLLKTKNQKLFSEKLIKFIYKIFRNKKKILKNILNTQEKSLISEIKILNKRPIHLKIDEIIELYKTILNHQQ
ncbi:MAG: hypothetical protein N2169_04625 [bacterium]|nr:hypothetical protein [bacterium]